VLFELDTTVHVLSSITMFDQLSPILTPLHETVPEAVTLAEKSNTTEESAEKSAEQSTLAVPLA
jgi:hypothetical protein